MWKTNGHVDSICRRRRKSAKPGAVKAPCSQQEVTHLLHRPETNRTVPLDKTRLWESNVLGMTERAHCSGNVRSAKANLRLFSATFLPNFNARPAHTTMASPVPSMSALRVLRQSIQPQVHQTTQVRHATLLRRPKRPYTFTQQLIYPTNHESTASIQERKGYTELATMESEFTETTERRGGRGWKIGLFQNKVWPSMGC